MSITLFLFLQVDENHYVVPSATSELQYDVDVAIGCCTCSDGLAGALCKHQSAVLNKFGHHESVPHVPTPQMRTLYHEIATGELPCLSVTFQIFSHRLWMQKSIDK